MLRVGAGVSYTRVISELGHQLPALAMASRTVGSPQIRNRGTVGATWGRPRRPVMPIPRCWPRSALVEVASVRGTPGVPVDEFFGAEAPRPGARRADLRLRGPAGDRPAAVLQGRDA